MKKFNRIFGTAATVAALLFSLTILSCSAASDGPSVIAFPPLPTTPTTTPEQTQTSNSGSLSTPLTLEAAEGGAVVTFVNKASSPVTYKVNGGTAQTIASGATENITLANISDKVEFFGDNTAYATSFFKYSHIACDKDCYVYGNIMSLVKSAHFEKATALEEGYTFTCFFINNTHIKNKSGADLLLPAATLADFCYYEMFRGCASLTAAPSLPATTLAEACYYYMFRGCTSLTAAPSLPATTLANSCYDTMFSGCSSLASAPELPATTLAGSCYANMFNGCTSLTAAPSLPAATLKDYCYSCMFSGCTSLTAAPSLPATTLAQGCYSSMFYGCASLTAAPSLPATTLANSCYSGMFFDCTSLASVTCLATDISASNCTGDWLVGVAASGTFTKADGMTSWPTNSASGIPTGWTVRDFSYSVPLTLEACVNGAVVTFDNRSRSGPVTYKVNGGAAQTIARDTTGTITLSAAGDKVEFFGDNNTYATDDYTHYSHIACSADCYVYGNIMSLIKSEGFENATALKSAYTFAYFFRNNAHIKNKDGAPLLLPAATLTECCYQGMFSGCTSLTAAPSLPAATLATLAYACYSYMFQGCASLTSVTCLATDISASSCTSGWLDGVAASGTFTKAAGMTGWTTGASGIPIGWTVVDKQ